MTWTPDEYAGIAPKSTTVSRTSRRSSSDQGFVPLDTNGRAPDLRDPCDLLAGFRSGFRSL